MNKENTENQENLMPNSQNKPKAPKDWEPGSPEEKAYLLWKLNKTDNRSKWHK